MSSDVAAYYNEFKPEAAHMLRQLIKDGIIAPGDVDERSIVDVRAEDLRGYTQCHFFAGIGGWSVALRLAEWPDDRPVWTGSCPCQPFSTAGRQKGHSDERHLWPYWGRLIGESKPPKIYGEQVAGAVAFGWLDEVFNDLEKEAYACAAAILPACSVNAPHKRDRLWFVAQSDFTGEWRGMERQSYNHAQKDGAGADNRFERPSGITQAAKGDMADAKSERNSRAIWSSSEKIGGSQTRNSLQLGRAGNERSNVANPDLTSKQGTGFASGIYTEHTEHYGNMSWISCPDGKARPIEPRIRLLVDGVQHRAPILHAFGNAIVPQVAAEFIKATQLY